MDGDVMTYVLETVLNTKLMLIDHSIGLSVSLPSFHSLCLCLSVSVSLSLSLSLSLCLSVCLSLSLSLSLS